MPIPVKPADGAEARLSFGPPVNPETTLHCYPVYISELAYIEECWKRVYYVGVENLTSALPADYFSAFNGKLYMKTPVLILYNNYSYSKPSAVVGASISLDLTRSSVGVYATFEAGPQLGDIFKGKSASLPSVTVWKSGDSIWGGQKYYGDLSLPAEPGKWAWGYFWGRPAMAIYEHYWVYISYWKQEVKYDDNDYAVYAVTDFYVVNNEIKGDIVRGKPDDKLMDMLFQGSKAEYVATLYPPGSGGDLSIRFEEIFRTFDECNVNFEIGIPFGAMIARYLISIDPRLRVAAALASIIGVSISAEGSSAYIHGVVANYGIVGNTGHNIFEDIYVRVSNYEYVKGSCKYNVPIGIYIDSR